MGERPPTFETYKGPSEEEQTADQPSTTRARVLDVGVGPGFLVGEMAEQVGPGGHVTGLDISDSMVALAQRRCA